MYSECVSCEKLGVSCAGPKFVAMPAPELIAWCKARKARLGLSNGKLAELSGMAKGTIDRLFAGEHIDFRYETIRPLVMALTGGNAGGNPCPAPHDGDNAELIKKAERLARNNKLLQERISKDSEQHQRELDFLREQIKHEQSVAESYKKAVKILSVLLGVSALVIVAALLIDRFNSEVGFFWVEALAETLFN